VPPFLARRIRARPKVPTLYLLRTSYKECSDLKRAAPDERRMLDQAYSPCDPCAVSIITLAGDGFTQPSPALMLVEGAMVTTILASVSLPAKNHGRRTAAAC